MRDFFINSFGNYSHEIIFIHVISAVIWVGGMIAIYIAVNPTFQLIEKVPMRLDKLTILLNRFFNFIIIFIIFSVITAVFMIVGMNLKESDNYSLVLIKESIWMIMLINFIYMYIQVRKSRKLLRLQEIDKAQESIEKLPKIFLPINIVLGVVAIWLGISLRGF